MQSIDAPLAYGWCTYGAESPTQTDIRREAKLAVYIF